MKKTVITMQEMKQKGEKISMLTCYDYSTAKLMEEAEIDMILVGDSLGNTMLGYENTLQVTMEDMISHSAAVSRGIIDTLLVCDMPFMSYQVSVEDAVRNAGRLVQEGHAEVVKLEGGVEVCPQIEAIVKASIPVCAHIGLTPQSINAMGGYKIQGRTKAAAKKLMEDALAVQKAGASMVVLEGVPAKLAKEVTEKLDIPTIGIGAGSGTDGQVLVEQDMLGMFDDYVPKFVRQFADAGTMMINAFAKYKKEVSEGTFPNEEESY
ncbi:MAG: 3-methyl-2-oxobutanoate hydroxymethyltransferase [Eubacterium sp.]|nr:3-methyl-2-oxobutanoate hydroxymethyltransferase [Eubacterium sp.]